MAKTGKDEEILAITRELNGALKCEEYEKMVSGMHYNCFDPDLVAARHRAICLTYGFNHLDPRNRDDPIEDPRARKLLTQLLGRIGERTSIVAPFRAEYGCNIVLGEETSISNNVTILDNSLVTIGNRVLIASNSCICAADHYTSVLSRLNYYLTSLPVRIEDDCWIGGGVHILPGVTIGRGSTIGSGSVVTRDIPPYSVAVGNPARVVRMVKSPEEERQDLDSRFREFMGPSWAKEKRESDMAAAMDKRMVANVRIKPSL
ncbi:hypothetical protein V5O48_016059 [Marasmius crinis-equi]|uniref:Maltose/galactoside acetyltransferase domain-containing protein n=1 Tax=Marasmius crinis-equi TaxID=585013 RepID=A0ABR3ESU6_9AGAR